MSLEQNFTMFFFFFLINFYLNVDCLEKLTLLTNTNTADIFTFLHLTI